MRSIRNVVGVAALLVLGAGSGKAFAAQEYDPAKAFIERVEGDSAPAAKAASAAPHAESDPAKAFLDRLAGVADQPAAAVMDHVDRDPARDFLARLAGVQPWMVGRNPPTRIE